MFILSDNTTIQIPVRLKRELNSFKDYAKETYAEVIRRLIELARENEESKMELSEETIRGLKEAEDDIRKGRVYTTAQVKKELGL